MVMDLFKKTLTCLTTSGDVSVTSTWPTWRKKISKAIIELYKAWK